MSTVAPVVWTSAGAVSGAWRAHRSADGSTSRAAIFLGIPYAEPPVGERRFLAPVPRGPWEGVRPATLHGATPQRRSPWPDAFVPEPSIPGDDLLTLDVGTPDPSPDAGMPVLVYLHGGGFVAGSHASPWYGGQAFHRDGVVTVTPSYRLGFDGFGWIDGAPLNRGVLDWLLALAWVHENIRAFGGDPAKVTIAGQSAGGAAVMRLLTMPAAQGLFRAVLALSPADTPVRAERARAVTVAGAARLGIAPDLDGLRSLTEAQVLDAQSFEEPTPEGQDPLAGTFGDDLVLSPVIDGDLVPARIDEAIAAGVGAGVALLVGATAHEFDLALADAPAALVAGDPHEILARQGVPAGLHDELLARVPGADGRRAAGQAVTQAVFRRHVGRWAGLRARGGASPRTWAYDFRWASPVDGIAGHCLDLPFGFDILRDPTAVRRAGTDAPQEIADAVHGDWLALIRDGRVDATVHAEGRATIVYGEPVRDVRPGYAFEERLAVATSAAGVDDAAEDPVVEGEGGGAAEDAPATSA
ncbi:carboxylesterase family protein [Demequina sp. SYSU T00192]|uniref:Carboxylic ester hydrolase n=1 Tax=Demequina litoralis TaxID=3051660 RepID=A0ABT8G805_9MICO|nr:carboxylesterase family protein [Demequina sp. SYSU T00192]MDN4475255.1 carboxylesterase family protein [Demequina sp. SYSU T00192]